MYVYPKLAIRGQNTRASLAVKIPVIGEPPTELWMAHVMFGEGLVKTTPRTYSATSSWDQVFSLGPAIDVAVVFDERWEQAEGGYYQAKTIGEPYFYFIQPITAETGRLVASRGYGTTPTIMESSGVSRVVALHGWKNVNNPTQDHGRIVAYVINGELWYRNYSEVSLGVFEWSDPAKISSPEDVVDVQLFRTPDYRVVFQYRTISGKVYMAYTSRVYAGVGITGPEIVRPYFEVSNTFEYGEIEDIETSYRDTVRFTITGDISIESGATGTMVSVARMYNPDAETIIVEFYSGVRNVNPSLVTFRDDSGRRFRIASQEVYGSNDEGSQIVFKLEDFNNAVGDITFIADVGGLINGLGGVFGLVSASFTPVGLVPVERPLPEFVRAYNEEDDNGA